MLPARAVLRWFPLSSYDVTSAALSWFCLLYGWLPSYHMRLSSAMAVLAVLPGWLVVLIKKCVAQEPSATDYYTSVARSDMLCRTT